MANLDATCHATPGTPLSNHTIEGVHQYMHHARRVERKSLCKIRRPAFLPIVFLVTCIMLFWLREQCQESVGILAPVVEYRLCGGMDVLDVFVLAQEDETDVQQLAGLHDFLEMLPVVRNVKQSQSFVVSHCTLVVCMYLADTLHPHGMFTG